MAISTFDELKASVADFLNRDDLTAVIPDFIKMAEADLNTDLRHRLMENRASATVNGQYTALPTDFLEPIRAHLEGATYRPIELISQADMQQRRQLSQDTSGLPSFYAITQNEFEVYPTPDSSYSIELNYYAKIPSLGASQATNVILTNFPQAYLYSSLVHSAPYLQEDARLATWGTLYRQAVENINRTSEQSKYGGVFRRMKIKAY